MIPPFAAEYLRSRLHYEPVTGGWTWLPLPENDPFAVKWNARCAHKPAGTKSGYVKIAIDNVSYLSQRLAYYYMTGEWPEEDVIHANAEKRDNRWSNLRPAPRSDRTSAALSRRKKTLT